MDQTKEELKKRFIKNCDGNIGFAYPVFAGMASSILYDDTISSTAEGKVEQLKMLYSIMHEWRVKND
jgi:hypothetical protein